MKMDTMTTQSSKILGIFGGMGPEATVDFYRQVILLTPAECDQDHIPTLIYSLPQVPDRTAAIRTGDNRIIPFLVEGVTRIERAGASHICIPCNTVHVYYDHMQAAVSIPILHLIRETVSAIRITHPTIQKVGLLATSGTLQSGVYETEFTAAGLTTIKPDDNVEQDQVMRAVYGIKSGEDKQTAEDLLAAAGNHVVDKGAEIIVLGCTEIPLAFNAERARVPVVNATEVLARAAVRLFMS